MSKLTLFVTWLISAICFGVITGVVALIITRHLSGPIISGHYQSITRSDVKSYRFLAEEFRKKEGRYPKSMKELKQWDPEWHWHPNASGEECDVWQHPIKYVFDDQNPQFISYGADGRIGGMSLSADISSNDEKTTPAFPTLWEFATLFQLNSFIIISLIAGGLGTLTWLQLVRPRHLRQLNQLPAKRLAINLGIISFLTYGITYAILMAK